MREKIWKNRKFCKKIAIFANFWFLRIFALKEAWGNFLHKSCLKIQVLPVDLSPFQKKSIVRFVGKLTLKIGGFLNFFLVFCKNPPNGWKYGKVIWMFFEAFAKAFHHVLKIWKSVDGRLRKCANHFGPKNDLFSLADFHYNALADFAQILTEGAHGR